MAAKATSVFLTFLSLPLSERDVVLPVTGPLEGTVNKYSVKQIYAIITHYDNHY